jgi:hypothetical protein
VFHARIQVCYRNKNFFYQSLNIDKAVSPYQVWNKVKETRRCNTSYFRGCNPDLVESDKYSDLNYEMEILF